MPILFLSHSGSDTEAARALKRRIEDSPAAREAGLKVWFDKDHLKAGKRWQAQLAAAIEKEADAFAVLLGARGIVNWVEAEVEVALSRATLALLRQPNLHRGGTKSNQRRGTRFIRIACANVRPSLSMLLRW